MSDFKSENISQPNVNLSEEETSKSVDTPRLYNLQEACERFFPNTAVQPCDLLSLAKKKKLRLTRMGKIKLVTSEAIQDMIELCREKESLHDCSRKNGQVAQRSGSSLTVDAKSAQVAAEKTFAELTKRSKTT